MKKIKFYFIFIFIVNISFSQNQRYIDSLQTYLKIVKNDSIKVSTQVNLSLAYCNIFEYKKAIYYSELAYDLAKKINYSSELANVVDIQTAIYFKLGNYPLALEKNKEALVIFEKLDSKEGVASVYESLGLISWRQGDFLNSVKNYYSALNILEQLLKTESDSVYIWRDKTSIASIYNNLGLVNWEMKDFNKAIENYRNALKIAKEINHQAGAALCYNNIGLVYIDEKKYDEALKNHFLSFEINKKINDKEGLSLNYHNIGLIYHSQGKYKEALVNYYESVKIDQEIGGKEVELAATYNDIGNTYFLLNDYNNALNYSLKSNELAANKGELRIIKDSEKSLSEIYEKLNDKNNALIHYKKYTEADDSIFSEEKNKQIIEINTKYETEKKEQEIELLKKTNEITTLNNRILIYATAAFALVIVLLMLILRQRKIKNKQKFTEIELRLNRARINPHFFFNSLTTLQGIAVKENDGKKIAINLYKFSNLMRTTLESSYNEFVTLEKEIEFISQYIELQLLKDKSKFQFNIVLDDLIDQSEIMVPSMIIQPFIENAIEHGFKSINYTGKIELSIKKAEDKILVSVIDNGIGLDNTSNTEHISRATQITKDRLFLLNKEIKKIASSFLIKQNEPGGVLVEIVLPLIYKK